MGDKECRERERGNEGMRGLGSCKKKRRRERKKKSEDRETFLTFYGNH